MIIYALPYSGKTAHRHDYASGLTEIHCPADQAHAVVSRQGKGMKWNIYVAGQRVLRTKTLSRALQALDAAEI